MADPTNLEVLGAALEHIEGMGLRRAADALGVSHERVRAWRIAKKDDTLDRVAANLHEKTRNKLMARLEVLPIRESPTYAEGVGFAVSKVEASLEELRALAKRRGNAPVVGEWDGVPKPPVDGHYPEYGAYAHGVIAEAYTIPVLLEKGPWGPLAGAHTHLMMCQEDGTLTGPDIAFWEGWSGGSGFDPETCPVEVLRKDARGLFRAPPATRRSKEG